MKQKGAAIRTTLKALESLHGGQALDDVRRAVSPRLREQLDGLLPVQWYPIELTAAVHVAIRDVVGQGAWDASHAIGVAAAKIEFTGLYRVMIRAVQYDTVWDRLDRVWHLYNSAGSVYFAKREPGHALAEIKGVAGFNVGAWRSVSGRIEGMLLLVGAKGVSVTVHDPTPTSARIEAIYFD